MVNLLVLGPVTIDRNIFENNIEESIGGAVYYESYVLENLGINYKIVTPLGKDDSDLISQFPDKNKVSPIYKSQTLYFENDYINNKNRIQKSNFAGNTITKSDIVNIGLDDYDGVLINPLVSGDADIDLLRYIKENNIPIFLSLQGLLRIHDLNNYVKWETPLNLNEILKYADVLFLDEFEAKFIYPNLNIMESIKKLSYSGPNEVIITENSKGSLIYSRFEEKIYSIDSFKVDNMVSPTGAGDTYMAAYISKRLNKGSIYESGIFASILTTVKLENQGPFNKNIMDVIGRFLDFAGF